MHALRSLSAPDCVTNSALSQAHEDSEPVLVSIPSLPNFCQCLIIHPRYSIYTNFYTFSQDAHEEVPQPSHQLPPGFWASLAGPVGAVITPCRADYLAVGFSVVLEREAVDEVEARMGKVGAYLPVSLMSLSCHSANFSSVYYYQRRFIAQVGPQFPESFWRGMEANSTPEHTSGSNSEEVLAFMDRALQRFGKESVLFIR